MLAFSTSIWVVIGLSGIWATPLAEDFKEEDPRIVHGQEAQLGSLPYQVSIQLNYDNRMGRGGRRPGPNKWVTRKASHFCGGTMVSEKWVLTAAHCMKGQVASRLKIVGGTNDLTDKSSPTFAVKRIVRQQYNDATKKNDMSLLEVVRKGGKTRAAHPLTPVPLCRESFEPQGKACTVSGWGHLKSKGSSVPDLLRKVAVTVLHDDICAKMLKGYPWDRSDKTMLCAGGEDKDACQGDSGGPMVCEEGGKSCIAGVVSWGVGCATEGIPGVYTNVRKYNDWIGATIAGKNQTSGALKSTLEDDLPSLLEEQFSNLLAAIKP